MVCLLDEFVNEIQSDDRLFNKFAGAVRIIENSCKLTRLNRSKFREIKGHSLDVKVYEAKSGEIRIYLFHEEHTGRIIVTGGV